MERPHIVIAGAGSIGCFVGAVLALAGHDVTMLGRGELAARAAREGLRLGDNDGWQGSVTPEQAPMVIDPACLARADLILVTVKSAATRDMGELIAEHAKNDAVILSLQNGIANAAQLRSVLPGRDVRAGMVGFNVVQTPEGHFHRATSGKLMAEKVRPPLAPLFEGSRLELVETDDIEAVLWGKLLINLNNALNALSGIALKSQLEDRCWRKVMAAQMEEGLRTLEAAGIEAHDAIPIPTRWMPRLLRLPTPLFKLVAGRTLRVDPEARSSMAEDFDRGRITEVDALQGAVIELAQKNGVAVPICTRVRDLVKAAERRGVGSPRLSPAQVAPGLM